MALKKKEIKSTFENIEEELEDHLDTINANTDEIMENRAMLQELGERIGKLSDMVQEIKLKLDEKDDLWVSDSIELTIREQEVFLTLYTSSLPLTYVQIGKKLSLPVNLVQEIVYSLIFKGVPIVKQKHDDVVVFLDLEFKEVQSKKNIVVIDDAVLSDFNRDIAIDMFEN